MAKSKKAILIILALVLVAAGITAFYLSRSAPPSQKTLEEAAANHLKTTYSLKNIQIANITQTSFSKKQQAEYTADFTAQTEEAAVSGRVFINLIYKNMAFKTDSVTADAITYTPLGPMNLLRVALEAPSFIDFAGFPAADVLANAQYSVVSSDDKVTRIAVNGDFVYENAVAPLNFILTANFDTQWQLQPVFAVLSFGVVDPLNINTAHAAINAAQIPYGMGDISGQNLVFSGESLSYSTYFGTVVVSADLSEDTPNHTLTGGLTAYFVHDDTGWRLKGTGALLQPFITKNPVPQSLIDSTLNSLRLRTNMGEEITAPALFTDIKLDEIRGNFHYYTASAAVDLPDRTHYFDIILVFEYTQEGYILQGCDATHQRTRLKEPVKIEAPVAYRTSGTIVGLGNSGTGTITVNVSEDGVATLDIQLEEYVFEFKDTDFFVQASPERFIGSKMPELTIKYTTAGGATATSAQTGSWVISRDPFRLEPLALGLTLRFTPAMASTSQVNYDSYYIVITTK